MSVLNTLEYPKSLEHIKSLMQDKDWRPPTYVFMDGLLEEITVVNCCTVLDDDDALKMFPRYPGAVFLKKKGVDDKYRLLPVQYNEETKQVESLG